MTTMHNCNNNGDQQRIHTCRRATYVRTCIHTYVYTHISTYVHTYIRIHTCIHTCMHVCMRMYAWDMMAHWFRRLLSTGGSWVRLPLWPSRRDLGQVLYLQLPVRFGVKLRYSICAVVGSAS